MKTIILLGGYGTRMRPHTWSRPKPLLYVAGHTVLGHILDLMAEITTDEVIFVVGYKRDQIKDWVREQYPRLDSHFVIQEEPLGQAHAVWLCRDHLQDDEPVFIAYGDVIINADFASAPEVAARLDADAVFFVLPIDDPRTHGVAVLDDHGLVTQLIEKPATREHNLLVTGANWFASDRDLFAATEVVLRDERKTLGEYFMIDAYNVLLERGARIVTRKVQQWSDTGQPQNLLQTNKRLLAAGHHSPDAIERSYAEDFTVMPPVFIHETASISASVIGPYATIGPDTTITGSVVRRSVVDRGAAIADALLDEALVGENATITGRALALFIGDNARIGPA